VHATIRSTLQRRMPGVRLFCVSCLPSSWNIVVLIVDPADEGTEVYFRQQAFLQLLLRMRRTVPIHLPSESLPAIKADHDDDHHHHDKRKQRNRTQTQLTPCLVHLPFCCCQPASHVVPIVMAVPGQVLSPSSRPCDGRLILIQC
jgi:hypothetical protein